MADRAENEKMNIDIENRCRITNKILCLTQLRSSLKTMPCGVIEKQWKWVAYYG